MQMGISSGKKLSIIYLEETVQERSNFSSKKKKKGIKVGQNNGCCEKVI